MLPQRIVGQGQPAILLGLIEPNDQFRELAADRIQLPRPPRDVYAA